jgi:2'-hydroxyisoflavone reductase
MKILILGGTIFLGKHLVNSAVKNGHQVTLFNRGKHNPELFPEIEKLKGDRDGDLSALAGRKFDAVIDTCGYFPRIVKNSAEFLKDNVNNYTFISSISVFKDFGEMGMHEDSGIATIEDETIEEITGESYGPLKYLCEKTVNEIYKDKALIIRPGLIVGEDDPSDRFTYWIYRINQGGKVLAPGPKEKHVQFIDVKDLADFTIRMIEKKATGTYNATGPDYNLTFEKFIDECKSVAGSNAKIEWIDQKFLTEAEVAPYTELPLWLPDEMDGGNNCNVSKAVENGLTFRPLKETLSDTLNYINSYIDSKKDYILRSGLKPEREKELIDKWQNKV